MTGHTGCINFFIQNWYQTLRNKKLDYKYLDKLWSKYKPKQNVFVVILKNYIETWSRVQVCKFPINYIATNYRDCGYSQCNLIVILFEYNVHCNVVFVIKWAANLQKIVRCNNVKLFKATPTLEYIALSNFAIPVTTHYVAHSWSILPDITYCNLMLIIIFFIWKLLSPGNAI